MRIDVILGVNDCIGIECYGRRYTVRALGARVNICPQEPHGKLEVQVLEELRVVETHYDSTSVSLEVTRS